MECDRIGCRNRQRMLHERPGSRYYCCDCNGCLPHEKAEHFRRMARR